MLVIKATGLNCVVKRLQALGAVGTYAGHGAGNKTETPFEKHAQAVGVAVEEQRGVGVVNGHHLGEVYDGHVIVVVEEPVDVSKRYEQPVGILGVGVYMLNSLKSQWTRPQRARRIMMSMIRANT